MARPLGKRQMELLLEFANAGGSKDILPNHRDLPDVAIQSLRQRGLMWARREVSNDLAENGERWEAAEVYRFTAGLTEEGRQVAGREMLRRENSAGHEADLPDPDEWAVSAQRLTLLREARELFSTGSHPHTRALIGLCLPGSNIVESRGDSTGPLRHWVVAPNGDGHWVDDPLESERGAFWLAGKALPHWRVATDSNATVEAWCQISWGDNHGPPCIGAEAPTLPRAICTAVLEALIYELERKVAT